MKKFKAEIEEKVVYRHTVVVKAENEDDVNSVLNKLERTGDHPDDIYYYFREANIEVVEFDKDSDGDGCEFECNDIEEIEE